MCLCGLYQPTTDGEGAVVTKAELAPGSLPRDIPVAALCSPEGGALEPSLPRAERLPTAVAAPGLYDLLRQQPGST